LYPNRPRPGPRRTSSAACPQRRRFPVLVCERVHGPAGRARRHGGKRGPVRRWDRQTTGDVALTAGVWAVSAGCLICRLSSTVGVSSEPQGCAGGCVTRLTAAPALTLPRVKNRGPAWCLWVRRSAPLAPPGTLPAACSPGGCFPVLVCERSRTKRAGTRSGGRHEATAARLPRRRLARGRRAACQQDDRTSLPRQVCRTIARQVPRQPRCAGAPAGPDSGETAGQGRIEPLARNRD